MKKYLIIISLFMALSAMTAQEKYRSIFGEHSTSFNILETMIDGVDVTDSFYYARDTILNDILYKQFFRTRAHYSTNNNSNYAPTSFLLRESEDRSKVFLRILNAGEWPYYVEDTAREYLVMDLNLNVQDNFYIHNGSYQPDSTLLIVKEVYYDNEGRKRINFKEDLPTGGYEIFEFIEGVGTNMGLFYIGEKIYDFTFGIVFLYLLCAYQDEINSYLHPSTFFYGGCSYFSMNISEEEKETIGAYPNPAQNYITIELGDSYCDYQSITIFDLLGRERMNIPITQSKQTISTQSLQNGYYLLHINSDKKNSLHKKLLIIK